MKLLRRDRKQYRHVLYVLIQWLFKVISTSRTINWLDAFLVPHSLRYIWVDLSIATQSC